MSSLTAFIPVFNTLCAISKTPTQILVFRFLAGFGGAAPQSLGGAVVGDLWSPEERAMAMSIYSLAPLVGPATGPLVGGWIAERVPWPWVFWSVSIACGVLQIAGFVCLMFSQIIEVLIPVHRSLFGSPTLLNFSNGELKRSARKLETKVIDPLSNDQTDTGRL